MATAKKNPVTAVEEPVKVAVVEEPAPVAAETAVAASEIEKTAKRARKTKAEEAPVASVAEKPAAKRTAAKKTTATPTVSVFVQVMGKEATPENMVARAKADWETQGHSIDEIKNLAVYLNAAEGRVYYVVNDDFNSGSFAF